MTSPADICAEIARAAPHALSSWADSRDKYRLLFDSIDEGFCVIEVMFDTQGRPHDYRFVEVNPSFERQTGLVDAAGRRMRELAPAHEQHWFDTYGEVALSGRAIRFENRAEALRRWYDVYAFRVGDPSLHLVAVLFNDVTQRKRAELSLMESDRRKDEFLAILAHELRNPLASISNALHVSRLAPGDAALAEQSRERMERQVQHMVRLIDDLMDVSRINRGLVRIERRREDLTLLVRRATEAAEPAIRQRGHELTVQLPADALHVDADAVRMTQALSNLLVNAAKYTRPGGHLALGVWREGQEAVLSVSDDGIGIPPDMLEAVFDLFTQTETSRSLAEGGLGIGLSLVRQIVGLHGGVVVAHSEGPGRGSRFVVRLPLAAASPETSPPAVPEARSPASRRMLVVDDNADAAESMASMLELLGHEVRAAFDGPQALQEAERFQPEIVLLDIGMPGMDGFTLARLLRQQPWARAATLVAVTGWARDADRAATQQAGFDHHLSKPIDFDALLALIAGAPARAH
ncbi:MAG: response regulator [Rhizobacter sp.]|nr:response regulator [Rhizobacter sp.]